MNGSVQETAAHGSDHSFDDLRQATRTTRSQPVPDRLSLFAAVLVCSWRCNGESGDGGSEVGMTEVAVIDDRSIR